MWAREPGFPTLVLLILEQQVSLASAAAAYDRLLARTGEPLDAHGAPRPRPMPSSSRPGSAARRRAMRGRSRRRSRTGRSTSTGSGRSTMPGSTRRSPRCRASGRGPRRSTGSWSSAAGCVADPRHRARPGVRRGPRPGRPAATPTRWTRSPRAGARSAPSPHGSCGTTTCRSGRNGGPRRLADLRAAREPRPWIAQRSNRRRNRSSGTRTVPSSLGGGRLERHVFQTG